MVTNLYYHKLKGSYLSLIHNYFTTLQELKMPKKKRSSYRNQCRTNYENLA